jgi:uncharacterized protein (DUF1778 family)
VGGFDNCFLLELHSPHLNYQKLLRSDDSMVRSITTKARDAITNAAQRSVKGVTSIAGDVLGAAAQAAADVVLESTTSALEAGRAKIKQSTPAMKRAIRRAAKVSTPVQRTTVAKRKTTTNRKAKRRSR